jgi:hypothetical protein
MLNLWSGFEDQGKADSKAETSGEKKNDSTEGSEVFETIAFHNEKGNNVS